MWVDFRSELLIDTSKYDSFYLYKSDIQEMWYVSGQKNSGEISRLYSGRKDDAESLIVTLSKALIEE